MSSSELDLLSINMIRTLAIDAIQKGVAGPAIKAAEVVRRRNVRVKAFAF
jgi:hypothetical protein